MTWSVGEEAAVVPVQCSGSNTAGCWKWWRIMCWQHCTGWVEAVLCIVARNLEFPFNSLLPILTLRGVFLWMFFQRTCILNAMKTTYSVQCCLSASGASLSESNEYTFKLTVNALWDAAWCTPFCFGLLGLCGTRSCHLLFFGRCYALVFVVLYFKRSEAQKNPTG